MPKTVDIADSGVSSKQNPKNTQPITPDSPAAAAGTTQPFTALDFKQLADNEHARYLPNAKKIGHALIKEEAGKKVAYQFPIAIDENDPYQPKLRPLLNIEEIEPFRGMHRYQAVSPNGTPMFAKRFIFGEMGKPNAPQTALQIACFSPTNSKDKKAPFWGSIKETPIFNKGLSEEAQKELKKELKELKPVFKGGDPLTIDHASVPQRDLVSSRNPSQNAVMGESARDAYQHFFESLSDELDPEMKARLKRAFNADIKGGLFVNAHRPEWLHLYGWSLTPMNENPQIKDNLGAGPKWANTQMMVLERIVKWFALKSPESLLTIQPKFEMMLDSELIKHIDFNVKIQIKDRYVKLMQQIDPHLAYPLFPKASDLAQGAAITYNVLQGVEPISKQEVKNAKLVEKMQVSSGSSSSSEPTIPKDLPIQKKKVSFSSEIEQPTLKAKGKADASLPKIKKSVKSVLPAKNNDHSAVQVYTTAILPDYDTPWRGPEETSWHGSGVIIEREGKKYILTNAHVVQNHIYMQIRFANDRTKKFEASCKCVSYQSDLALLEVNDPEFQALAKPAELGEMPTFQQKVMTVGFPIGGEEVSLSKGIVSRIEVNEYSMSGERMLQVGVDAAINSGNSGGPVFSNGKVVGLAFQGIDRQGLGFMIPAPIIHHFLQEAFSGRPYRGFPVIPFVTDGLENEDEREFYNLGDRTGVRIKRIDYLSDAYSKLEPDDILLSIDGMQITNEGTVNIPDMGNCIIDFVHVTHSKFIGDTVRLEVLRRDEESGETHLLEIDVVLDCVPGDTEKVGVTEHDKMPTYFIHSGLCFIPLTQNYMEGAGSDFEELQQLDSGCTLANESKEEPDEQIIVISHILKCKETNGYEKYNNPVVKEINGARIKNMRDVVLAMENHDDVKHRIRLAGDSKIIVKNMDDNALKAVLKRHHIPSARSADLLPAPEMSILVEQSQVQALKHVAQPHVSKSSEPVMSSTQKRKTASSPIVSEALAGGIDLFGLFDRKDVDMVSPVATNKSEGGFFAKRRRIDSAAATEVDGLPPLTADMMPGLKKYKASLDALEQRYKDAPQDDTVLGDTDDEDFEDYSSSSESSTSGAESLTDNEPLLPSSKSGGPSRFKLFANQQKSSALRVESSMVIKYKS